MKYIIILCIFFFSALAVNAQDLVVKDVDVNGVMRSYLLYTPSGYNENSASLPVVFNFHGFGSNAIQEQIYTNMNAVAEANDFFVIYPEGIDAAWNVGWEGGVTSDDIGFTSAMIDKMHSEYQIDLDRVYSCGMSNGGFFSYVLACELNDKIAAIASVTGSVVPGYVCEPGKAVPVMQIHGTDDATVMYDGTPDVSIPVEEVVSFWVDNNGCIAEPNVIEIEDTNTSDRSTAERIEYNGCDNDAAVIFYKVEGGEHTWPGAAIPIGVTNQDFNASEEIWNFFSNYTLDGVIADTEDLRHPSVVQISPNPATTMIYLTNGADQTGKYRIFTASGNVVLQGELKRELDIAMLSDGLYFILLDTDKGRTISKFQKM